MRKRTKIIATVGPVSGSREKLRQLVEAGVDVFRINFSHGDEQQRDEFLTNIRAVEAELQHPVAVCADLCGPKIRVGMICNGQVNLTSGQLIVVQRAPIEGTADRISTTLPELVDMVKPGEIILLADGRLRFEVVDVRRPEQFTCLVVFGGPLASGKGVNLPQTDLPISALTEKDRRDIKWIADRDFDFVALSFVRTAGDVDELRRLLGERGSSAPIIAKIEKPQALDHIDAIIGSTDAVMVARGDLGVEMDFPTIPMAQKLIAHKCQKAGKPCIIATEMLESMISSPRPTRAEVSDVANAVFDHADAVMLSAESSIGQLPAEAVTAMNRIVVAAEGFLEKYGSPRQAALAEPKTTAALAASVHTVMEMQEVAAIAVFMVSGTSARLLSKNRPTCPIIGLASDASVGRRGCLYFGLIPRLIDKPDDIAQLLDASSSVAKSLDLAKSGDHIIVLAGNPLGQGGTRGLIVKVVD